MEHTTENSRENNAAKTAGYAAAIVLTGAAAVSAKRWITRKFVERRTSTPSSEQG